MASSSKGPFQVPQSGREWFVALLGSLIGLLAGGVSLNLLTKVFG
jgi:hypothetical protein